MHTWSVFPVTIHHHVNVETFLKESNSAKCPALNHVIGRCMEVTFLWANHFKPIYPLGRLDGRFSFMLFTAICRYQKIFRTQPTLMNSSSSTKSFAMIRIEHYFKPLTIGRSILWTAHLAFAFGCPTQPCRRWKVPGGKQCCQIHGLKPCH